MTTATLPKTARAASPLTTLGVQTKAELLSLFRSPGSLVLTLLFPIMFWVFFGLPVANETTRDGFSVGAYILGSYAMYSMIQTVLFNLGISIASERSTGWYKFQRTTPLRIWVMFSAKLIATLLLALVALFALLVVGAVTGGVKLPLMSWVSLVARVMFGVLPFAALAVLIGYLARGANTASPLINIIFFPMAFGSGLFVPLSNLPKIVQDLAPFLPAYHGGVLARVAVGVPSASSEWVHVACLLGFTVVFLALAVWAYRRDEGTNYR